MRVLAADEGVDNGRHLDQLVSGAQALGIALERTQAERLWAYALELLKWNQKINLTSITKPEALIEKHLVDSLALDPEVRGARSLLDLGAGAGFPGLVLATVSRQLEVTEVESVAKKVGFLKRAIVVLGLEGRARAVRARAEGRPAAEGLTSAEVVVSRALMDWAQWLRFAAPYVIEGGRVIAMVARRPDDQALEAAAREAGLELVGARAYELPHSKDPRAVLSFRRPARSG